MFKNWLAKTLPTVYGDEMSLYEVMNKVIKELAEAIDQLEPVIEEKVADAISNIIDDSGDVTEAGEKCADAVELNEDIEGTLAYKVAQSLHKEDITTAVNVTDTGEKCVDAVELNGDVADTIAFVLKHLNGGTTLSDLNDAPSSPRINICRYHGGSDNKPTDNGGFVITYANTDVLKVQLAVDLGRNYVAVRYCSSGTWHEWVKVIRDSDLVNSSAVTNAGVYAVDATENNPAVTGSLRYRLDKRTTRIREAFSGASLSNAQGGTLTHVRFGEESAGSAGDANALHIISLYDFVPNTGLLANTWYAVKDLGNSGLYGETFVQLFATSSSTPIGVMRVVGGVVEVRFYADITTSVWLYATMTFGR